MTITPVTPVVATTRRILLLVQAHHDLEQNAVGGKAVVLP